MMSRNWLIHVRRLTNLKSKGQSSKLDVQREGMLHLESKSNWLEESPLLLGGKNPSADWIRPICNRRATHCTQSLVKMLISSF